MKIRMLVSISGHADPRYGIGDFAFAPGEIVDLDKTLATAWVAAGHAERCKASAKPESTLEVKADDSADVQEGA